MISCLDKPLRENVYRCICWQQTCEHSEERGRVGQMEREAGHIRTTTYETANGKQLTAQGAQLLPLWQPRGVGWLGQGETRGRGSLYTESIHFFAWQKLTQRCKEIILQLKQTKNSFVNFGPTPGKKKNVLLVQIIMTDVLENTGTVFARRVLICGIISTDCAFSIWNRSY